MEGRCLCRVRVLAIFVEASQLHPMPAWCLQVDASMQSTSGGGLLDHAECIEVLSLPLQVRPRAHAWCRTLATKN